MIKLSEKQILWAEKIKKNMSEYIEKEKAAKSSEYFPPLSDDGMQRKAATCDKAIKIISDKSHEWFIVNRKFERSPLKLFMELELDFDY